MGYVSPSARTPNQFTKRSTGSNIPRFAWIAGDIGESFFGCRRVRPKFAVAGRLWTSRTEATETDSCAVKNKREQKLMDNGYRVPRRVNHADESETSSQRDFRQASEQIAAATERIRQGAKGNSAAATAVAAATARQVPIPLHASTSDLKKYSAAAIRNWMGRRRRAGLSVLKMAQGHWRKNENANHRNALWGCIQTYQGISANIEYGNPHRLRFPREQLLSHRQPVCTAIDEEHQQQLLLWLE